MTPGRSLLALVLACVCSVGLLSGGQALAAPQITQEIHISATVPDRRHIILSPAGNIIKITSNTPNDVMPEAFVRDDTPENQVPLTPELLAAYRKLVPVGTAKYGILYEQPTMRVILTSSSPANPQNPIVTNPQNLAMGAQLVLGTGPSAAKAPLFAMQLLTAGSQSSPL